MHTLIFDVFCNEFLALISVVRACKWGDGNELFATASDPFTSRDLGFINIFTCPIEGETEFEGIF